MDKAIEILRQGGVIGMPTETVYGLAGAATMAHAVALIFALKNRPTFNPLIAHVANVSAAQDLIDIGEAFLPLVHAFWPGPLTLVGRRIGDVALLATSGLETLAVRVPAHPVAMALLEALPFPLVAPSANLSGALSPTQAQHVRGAFPDLHVLEGGPAAVGLESTILDISGEHPLLLRMGAVTQDQIEGILGRAVHVRSEDGPITAPGQLKRHYAPQMPLRLNVKAPREGETFLSFGSAPGPFCLSATGDLVEAAANLFQMLHRADALGRPIAVAPIPDDGIGRAINDRLRRGAQDE